MIQKVLSVLLFFPSLTFNLIQSEIFPWAILKFSLIRIRFSSADLIMIALILFGSVIGFVSYPAASVISTAASYINPLVAFILIRKSSAYSTQRIILIVQKLFWIFASVGIAQCMGILNVLDPLFDILIPRGGASVVGVERGASIFSTEPSRASVELVFMYAILAMDNRNSQTWLKGTLLMDLIFVLLIIFVGRSATGLLFCMIFVISKYPIKSLPTFIFGAISASFFTLEIRSIDLVSILISQEGLGELIKTITVQSGFRIISVVSAYVYAINTWFGCGVGAWTTEAILSYQMAGYTVEDTNYFIYNHNSEFVNLKPTAFMALIALEFGFFGLILATFIVLKQLKPGILCSCKNTRAVIFMLLLYIFIVGAVGNPIPWVCGALAINLLEEKVTTREEKFI